MPLAASGGLPELAAKAEQAVKGGLGCQAVVDNPGADLVGERGVSEDEARQVFNLGIGMCAVVPEAPPGALVIGALE